MSTTTSILPWLGLFAPLILVIIYFVWRNFRSKGKDGVVLEQQLDSQTAREISKT